MDDQIPELTEDQQEILRLHRVWWISNHGLDIPAMRSVFPPADDQYLMYNLNLHPYFGLEEKTKLWEYYTGKLELFQTEVWVHRIDVSGDLAYLACEGVWHAKRGDETEVKWHPVRATEVYRRDDGAGNPVWKMWHFHCSLRAQPDAKRPGFGDTYDERGVGYLPYPGAFRSVSHGS